MKKSISKVKIKHG